jgi:hypothetical protein
LSLLDESQTSRLHLFAASAFIAMSHGYKLLAENQPSNSTVWNHRSARLLDKAIDVLNTNAESHGVETLKRTLCFKLIASRRELGRPYRAEGLVKTHQLLNAPKDDGKSQRMVQAHNMADAEGNVLVIRES